MRQTTHIASRFWSWVAHPHLVLFRSVLFHSYFSFFFRRLTLVLNLSIPFLLIQFTHTLLSSNGCGFHLRQHKMLYSLFIWTHTQHTYPHERESDTHFMKMLALHVYENSSVCSLILKWTHWMRNFSEKWVLYIVVGRINCMVKKKIFKAEKLLLSRKLS